MKKPADITDASIEVIKDLDTVLQIHAIITKDPSEAAPSDFSDWASMWDKTTFIVAKVKGRVVGFCVLVDDELAPLLDVLYVVPKMRNRKLGAQLVAKAKTLFNRLTLIANDPDAGRFYERNGFTNKGVVYHMLGYGEHATVFNYGEFK